MGFLREEYVCFFFFLIGDLRNENTGYRGDVTSVLFSVGQGYIDMGKRVENCADF